ncbi:FxDxF family PEP-CTERM protein [Pseudothauera lacus]|uniref:Ice-binding protein C-terminal domain-containing protein n=1 Tax=Pseudothauera lacus TaxID=2136175 RepID=A0A2T4IK39_9RHOO|nr:FxDxF family PEP-CTERM protein [Pseudothauera lacus]PTD98132.1 hypothetical protein C8261_01580 [Pseudothauera lacus]
MTFKKTLVALGIGLAMTGAANAATYDLGEFSGISVIASTVTTAKGAFSDTWNFSLAGDSFTVGAVFDLPSLLGLHYNISSLSAQLFSSSGALVVDFDDCFLSSKDFKFSLGTLVADSYSLLVSGNATGWAGGRYELKMTAKQIAAPVPEPQTLLMMLSGLGLLGAVARRRRLG